MYVFVLWTICFYLYFLSIPSVQQQLYRLCLHFVLISFVQMQNVSFHVDQRFNANKFLRHIDACFNRFYILKLQVVAIKAHGEIN